MKDMDGDMNKQLNSLKLHVPPRRLICGLLLFAMTWGIIPIVVVCFTYRIPNNQLWLAVLIDSVCYFLLGLMIGLLFFGGLRLWLNLRRNRSSWLILSFIGSIMLLALEATLVGASLVTLISQLVGLIISSIISSLYWLETSRNEPM